MTETQIINQTESKTSEQLSNEITEIIKLSDDPNDTSPEPVKLWLCYVCGETKGLTNEQMRYECMCIQEMFKHGICRTCAAIKPSKPMSDWKVQPDHEPMLRKFHDYGPDWEAYWKQVDEATHKSWGGYIIQNGCMIFHYYENFENLPQDEFDEQRLNEEYRKKARREFVMNSLPPKCLCCH